jgi:hypothetical protein
MHDILYSAKRDEIYVTNPFAQAIIAFKGDATGEATPVRIIQGPKTKIAGADTLEIDDTHGEILIPNRNGILAFPIEGNGDVAPLRNVEGNGWRTGGGIAVDPIHNVLVTDGTIMGEKTIAKGRAAGGDDGEGGSRRDTILIFDRLADGKDVKPIRAIRGPKTGIQAIRQMQIYPPKGWIIIAQITDGGIEMPENAFVGVWSVNDDGDVPPRWKIDANPAKTGMQKPRGVALNPKNKELIVSDMRLNAVLTFFFPEMY